MNCTTYKMLASDGAKLYALILRACCTPPPPYNIDGVRGTPKVVQFIVFSPGVTKHASIINIIKGGRGGKFTKLNA